MSDKQKSTGQKWQTVIKILAAYLVAAWTFLQFVDWILIRYNISPYWVDILLWTFVGVIPSLVIYLYNKDRINEGILKLREKIIIPLNVLVIGILIFFVFGNSDLGSTKKEISFTDELGNLETQTITKEEFRVGLSIFSFEQQEKDTINGWIGDALKKLITIDLKQNKAISPEENNAQSTVDKVKISSVFHDFYVDGEYKVLEDNSFKLKTYIRNSKNGKEIKSKVFIGADLFALVDQISNFIKNNLGIIDEAKEKYIDLDIKDITTSSLEALKLWVNREFDEAVKIDDEFTLAYYDNAIRRNRYSQGELEEKFLIDKAYRLRNNLPSQKQFEILMYKNIIYNNWQDAAELIRYQLEIEPNNEEYNDLLEIIFSETKDIDGYYQHAKDRFNRTRNESSARSYYMSLILKSKYKEALNLVKAFELLAPNTEEVQHIKAYTYFISDDIERAKETYRIIQLKWPRESIYRDLVDDYLEKYPTLNQDFDEDFSATYRSLQSEQEVEYFKRDESIFVHYQNQNLHKGKVFSKNEIFSLDPSWVSGTKHTFEKDSLGHVFRVKVDQFNWKRLSYFYYYKEYDDIKKALGALQSGKKENLVSAFEKLVEKYPSHYFLRNLLQHAKYVDSKSNEELLNQYKKVVGTYDNRLFWMADNRLYYKRDNLAKLELLPISETRYINLSKLNTNHEFEFLKDNKIASFAWTYDLEKNEWISLKDDNNYLLKN